MAHFLGLRFEGLGVKVGGLGFWLIQGEPIDIIVQDFMQRPTKP